MKTRVGIVLLCVALLLTAIPFAGVLADTLATGTVRGNDLRVRSGPGTGYSVLGYLYYGNKVTIHETVNTGSGKWYKITTDTLAGYVSADYVTVDVTYETDEEFERYLTAQGFPESYKPGLRQIHAEYPHWIFRATGLTMTWAEALAYESRPGINTIQSPEAWYSMEYGAYNWSTGDYTSYDTGGWRAAKQSVVAYYMDPRAWLDSTSVFQFEELSYSEAHTVDDIRAILPDVLDKHAEDLLAAAKESGVSAYHLAVRIAQEGTHINGLALGNIPGYEGYYNFFNMGAYAHDGNSAVQNGAIYAKNHGWDTPYKSLLGCANIIGAGYIKLGQDTAYYQKFNVVNTTSGLYSHQYMTNVAAPSSEAAIRRSKATAGQLNSALVFDIPVYLDMPETVATRPSTTGNNNNFLDSITVDGYTLTPSFDRYTMQYALQVNEDVTSVNIAAVCNSSGAVLEGGGIVAVHPGSTTISLTVTATSGDKRVYHVTVTRPGGDIPIPTIGNKDYRVDAALTGVEPDTTAGEFLDKLAVQGGSAVLCNASGQPKTDGPVATGDILRLYNGDALCASYPVLIYGEVNGDGRVTSLDLRIIQKHILGIAPLNGYALSAADTSRDGKVTSLDLRVAQKFILGITASIQTKP